MRIYLLIAFFLVAKFGVAQETENQQDIKVWSLQDCIDYAIDHNITVKKASYNETLAEINYDQAKASRLPNVYSSIGQTFSNGNTIDPITSDYVSDQVYSANMGINSSVTLFQGNQIKNEIKQNGLLLEQSAFLVEAAQNDIKISILETYLQALHSKEGITIAENNLKATEAEVERAKSRLDAGAIALNEYTEALSQSATNKYNVIAAKNNYDQYILALKQLLELEPSTEIALQEIEEDNQVIGLTANKLEAYQNALDYLPEVAATDLNIAIIEKDLAIAKGGYLPSLSLTGSIGTGYTTISDLKVGEQFNANFNQKVGMSLYIPIFNKKQTKSAVETSKINIEMAQLDKAITEKEVYRKVETAWQNVIASNEQLSAANSALEASSESYRLAQKKYELGALSTTDLVISQNTYTNAQQNYIQAKYLNILYSQLLQFYQGNDIKL